MKLTKMAGAFALTAAMAMTAVPAFAAVGADNTENFKDSASNEATATTKVYAETINAQLNATIPTRVAIVMPSMAGGDITAPSSDVYKIINKTTSSPIYLKKVGSASSGFQLASTTPTTGLNNVLAMKLAAGSFSTDLTGTDATVPSGTPVSIAANGGELGLALSGKSYIGTALSASQLDSAIMTITYTIGTTA